MVQQWVARRSSFAGLDGRSQFDPGYCEFRVILFRHLGGVVHLLFAVESDVYLLYIPNLRYRKTQISPLRFSAIWLTGQDAFLSPVGSFKEDPVRLWVSLNCSETTILFAFSLIGEWRGL